MPRQDIVEGAIQGAGAIEVAVSTGGAVATDRARVAEDTVFVQEITHI